MTFSLTQEVEVKSRRKKNWIDGYRARMDQVSSFFHNSLRLKVHKRRFKKNDLCVFL